MLWKYLRKFPKFSSSASKKVETKKCNFSKNRLCDFLEFFNYIKASISGVEIFLQSFDNYNQLLNKYIAAEYDVGDSYDQVRKPYVYAKFWVHKILKVKVIVLIFCSVYFSSL